jgi:hypothetical protein
MFQDRTHVKRRVVSFVVTKDKASPLLSQLSKTTKQRVTAKAFRVLHQKTNPCDNSSFFFLSVSHSPIDHLTLSFFSAVSIFTSSAHTQILYQCNFDGEDENCFTTSITLTNSVAGGALSDVTSSCTICIFFSSHLICFLLCSETNTKRRKLQIALQCEHLRQGRVLLQQGFLSNT